MKPPPEPFLMESYDFNTGGEDKDQEFTNSTRIKVPDGYQAIRATVGKVVAIWDGWSVDVVIGQRAHRFDGGAWVWSTPLDEETGSVPFAVVTDKVGDIAVAVEVICESPTGPSTSGAPRPTPSSTPPTAPACPNTRPSSPSSRSRRQPRSSAAPASATAP